MGTTQRRESRVTLADAPHSTGATPQSPSTVPEPQRTQADDPRMRLLAELLRPGVPNTSFLAAVRLLDRILGAAIGRDAPMASAEPLRFRHSPSLASKPNELASIRLRRPSSDNQLSRSVLEVTTTFLGLSGADSPLALYFTDQLGREDDDAAAQNAFLDIFHHRLATLFFQLVNKYSFPHQVSSVASDVCSRRALAFVGYDVPALADAPTLPNRDLLRLAALLTLGGTTARTVENALRLLLRRDLAGAPLELRQFTGEWVTFDRSQWNQLGRSNHRSGSTFIIGTRVRHPAHRAEIIVGPMTPGPARAFQPSGSAHRRIVLLLESILPRTIEFDLIVLVQAAAYPRFILGRRRLGNDVYICARDASSRIVKYRYPIARLPAAPAASP